MDRAELEHLLGQVNADKAAVQNEVAALQSRLTALTKAADGLQALLDMTPAPREFISKADSDTARAREAEHIEVIPQGRGEETPKGREAARLILESDISKFWSVRQVWNEEVRRGWAEARPRGAKGNPPARVALMRLHQDFPENVEVIDTPVLAYRWIPSEPSRSLNGSGR